jgi:hypothetical protein
METNNNLDSKGRTGLATAKSMRNSGDIPPVLNVTQPSKEQELGQVAHHVARRHFTDQICTQLLNLERHLNYCKGGEREQ